jgi:hypothetical protein
MRFWLHEIAGWVIVGLGLITFYGCYDLLLSHYWVETGTLTIIGIFLFRGGIHLLKMAVAARVCMEAQEKADAARPHSPTPAGKPSSLADKRTFRTTRGLGR